MGRPRKATEAEAFAIMDRLFKEGKAVTVASVTAELGGGSTTTIGAFVRAWRRLQDLKWVSSGHLGETLSVTINMFWDEIERVVSADQPELVRALEQKLADRETQLKRLGAKLRSLEDRNIALETELRVLRKKSGRKKP